MTIEATVPLDTDFVSTLATRDREERLEINRIWSALGDLGAVATYTAYNCSGGQTSIPIGETGLADVGFEVVYITGSGVATIGEITGGSSGQVKIFVMGDGNIYFENNVTGIDLNQPLEEPDFGGEAKNIIALVNIGGDPNVPTNGVWRELFRTPNAR